MSKVKSKIVESSFLNKLSMHTVEYNKQLKKLQFVDIDFNSIMLSDLPEPYFRDETARSYNRYDTFGFRDILLALLSEQAESNVLKVFIITPKSGETHYDAFAYLQNKEIIRIQFYGQGNFKQWMDIIFEDQYKTLQEYEANGQFEIQPELNRNSQFMLTLAKGNFSQRWVNSGMLVDEKPYQDTGAYLYKNAPAQYNEAKIAKEKERYLKKYINTDGASFDPVKLQSLFRDYIDAKSLQVKSPKNNDKIYEKFESLSGYEFPKELKSLLILHNGVDKTGFLNGEQILTEWKNWKEIYDDVNWMLIDLTGNNHADGRNTIGMYTNPYWIPFFSTGGGNFIAVDYAPGSKGFSGQIIAFGADESKIRLIAKNMEDFLQQFLDGKDVLNNGL